DYPDSSPHSGMSAFDFPPPQPQAPPGTTIITGYPSEDPDDNSEILLSWPAQLNLTPQDKILLDLFLGSFANGQTSRLYNRLIDSQTRGLETGADWVGASVSDYLGNPIRVNLEGVDSRRLSEGLIDSLRQIIHQELETIIHWENDNTELKQFNADALSRLEAQQKWLGQFLNKPPMFGFRDGYAGAWFNILERLEKIGGFQRSLVLKDELNHLREQLQNGGNIWREPIAKWKLLEVQPYAAAIKPDPSLVQKAVLDKEQRLTNKVNELEKLYGTSSKQKAIASYKQEFDAATVELESRPGLPLPGFVQDPPLTLDHLLHFETLDLPGGVPLVASNFDNMTSSTLGLAFDLRVLPESLWVYIPLLPAVLSEIGVIKAGDTISFSEMELRLRQETLSYAAYYSANPITGRVELVLRGSAAGEAELHNLLGWMEASLHSPLLETDNLPHLIDRVDRASNWTRNRMKGSEEDWVDSPAEAWRHQDDARFMATNCFLTQAHYLQRLRWRLTDGGEEINQAQWDQFFRYLEKAGKSGNRKKILKKLDDASHLPKIEFARRIAEQIKDDLRASLSDIPDESLTGDWFFLCRQIKSDLHAKPERALAEMKQALGQILRTGGMRAFIISNPHDRAAVAEELNRLVSSLPAGKPRAIYIPSPVQNIKQRLLERNPKAAHPVYVGLVNPDTRNGVLIFSAKDSSPWDTSRSALLNTLSGNLFAGGGSHSLFTRTWEAGLAYSNGFRYRSYSGWMQYYAERCPDVAETMRFVVDVLRASLRDSSLVEYAVALCFGLDRSASPDEQRGESMAADLADGFTPDRVAAFRRAVLALRNEPGLWEELLGRMEKVYGMVLIGYGPDLDQVWGGSYFSIGPDSQFIKLERLIASAERPQPVFRLYPRDFWLEGK
ncbi:MAG: insulinase family protein, partial [Calditrichota bacterium]